MNDWIIDNKDCFTNEQIDTLHYACCVYGNNCKTFDDWAYYWFGCTFEQLQEDFEKAAEISEKGCN